MIRVSVVGAAGYSGAEAVRLLARHPHVELAGPLRQPGREGGGLRRAAPRPRGPRRARRRPVRRRRAPLRGARRRDPGDAERGLGRAGAEAPGGGRAGDRRLGSFSPAGRLALPGLVRLRAPRSGAPRRGRLRPHGVVRRGARRRPARRKPGLLPDLRPPRAQAARALCSRPGPAALRDVGERGLGGGEEGRAGLLVLRAFGQLQGLRGRDAPARARDAAGAGPCGRGRVHVRPAPPARRPRDPLDDPRLVRRRRSPTPRSRSGTPRPTPAGRS